MVHSKLLTGDQARVTKTQHKSPCCDCPYRRKSIKGWLGQHSVGWWLVASHGEGIVECHTKIGPKGEPRLCAGLAIYRSNVCKRTEFLLPKNTILVFANPIEFASHHSAENLNSDQVRELFVKGYSEL